MTDVDATQEPPATAAATHRVGDIVEVHGDTVVRPDGEVRPVAGGLYVLVTAGTYVIGGAEVVVA